MTQLLNLIDIHIDDVLSPLLVCCAILGELKVLARRVTNGKVLMRPL